MREKKTFWLVTFFTTTDAMAMEQLCTARQLPGRLIPVPREIHAGCGLAWRAPLEAEETLRTAMTQAGLRWEATHSLPLWVWEKEAQP